MTGEKPKESRSVFRPTFIDWLDTADDPPSALEAEGSGDWKVYSLGADQHLVLRGWQDPAQDTPAAVFTDRAVALLCAAVLPLDARPTLFVLSRPAAPPHDGLILIRDAYGPESQPEPVGRARRFSENQLLALHLAGGLTRSPHSLALVLEAAGPTAIRLVGEILHRRLGLRD